MDKNKKLMNEINQLRALGIITPKPFSMCLCTF